MTALQARPDTDVTHGGGAGGISRRTHKVRLDPAMHTSLVSFLLLLAGPGLSDLTKDQRSSSKECQRDHAGRGHAATHLTCGARHDAFFVICTFQSSW